MGNTCNELLEYCLRGEPWPDNLLDRALAVDDGRAFLSIVVERLGDLFEPRLCETYNRLFTQVILQTAPDLAPRLRNPNVQAIAPESASRVYVLSRVTLGADVAVTSVMLDAAKRGYPSAEVIFVGPQKSYELFEADPRITHLPAPYARSGALRDRLRASARFMARRRDRDRSGLALVATRLDLGVRRTQLLPLSEPGIWWRRR